MIIAFLIILLLVLGTYVFLQQAQFGKMPSGERLQQIKQSPNYRDGAFQNQSHTPDLAEGVSYYKVLKEFLFNKSPYIKPSVVLPSVKTDLHSLSPSDNCMVWFGHSSYFIQIDGKKILVDPVFSRNASPVNFTTKSFEGSDIYTPDDIPEIDYLFISHDHWDHLDYPTILKLKPKIKQVITGLGTGAHLEHWGYKADSVIEKDWNEEIILEPGFVVHTCPGRHFSGRGFKRNQVLWMSFALKTPSFNIFLGGDSGYDFHFKEIGEKYGPFDLAILECGQYNKNWKYIHMMPEEIASAATELRTTYLFPVHWAKFALAQHAWNEPINRVIEESREKDFSIIHPLIGENVNLNEMPVGRNWWQDLR